MEAYGPNGRWQLTHTLGAGGHAVVHAALDTRFESPVAIKVLADNWAANIDIRERFLSEALLQRRMAGPVVPVHDIGETPDGRPFIVMALANGGDLETRVKRWRASAQPSADHVAELASILRTTVGALHARNVVHRDLKPSNMLLFGPAESEAAKGPDAPTVVASGQAASPGQDPATTGAGAGLLRHLGPDGPARTGPIGGDEQVLLGDLGFAKNLADGSGLTVGGGTPGYLPPEQRGPGTVDRRADIWAASAIIHWFLTGRPPHETAGVRRNDLMAAGAEPELVEAIETGMADDPDRRPDSMADWERTIRRALIPASPSPQRSSGGSGRRSLAVAAVVAVGFGLIAGFGGAALLDGPEQSMVRSGDEAGTSRTSASLDGVTVAVVGPTEMSIGETVTFTAEIPAEIAQWTWVTPAGSHIGDNRPELPITSSRTGTGTVTLLASGAAGRVISVRHQFEVVEEPS